MWRQTTVPFCGGGSCREVKEWSAARANNHLGGFPECPAELVHQLSVNHLQVDNQTVVDGNCGPDAFVISLADQRTHGTATAAGVKQMHNLFKLPVVGPGRRNFARQEGLRWLRDRRQAQLQSGYTAEAFCFSVSGLTYESYLCRMAMDAEWADTVLILGMACAFGVDAVIFQVGMDPVLIGISLMDDKPDQASICASSRLVPMALANDRHFWGIRTLEDSDLLNIKKVLTASYYTLATNYEAQILLRPGFRCFPLLSCLFNFKLLFVFICSMVLFQPLLPEPGSLRRTHWSCTPQIQGVGTTQTHIQGQVPGLRRVHRSNPAATRKWRRSPLGTSLGAALQSRTGQQRPLRHQLQRLLMLKSNSALL